MCENVAEDDDDSGRTTSVDLVEDFVNEMSAAHACARASANSADMTDVDVDAIQPLMGAKFLKVQSRPVAVQANYGSNL